MDIDNKTIKELMEFLGRLDPEINVIVHGSKEEMGKTARSLRIEGYEREKISKIQEKSKITGYVLHDKPKALAGTREGLYEVENLETQTQRTFSGAGDRFDAGLALGLASG